MICQVFQIGLQFSVQGSPERRMPDVVKEADGARDEKGDDEVEEVDEVIVGELIELARVAPEISQYLFT